MVDRSSNHRARRTMAALFLTLVVFGCSSDDDASHSTAVLQPDGTRTGAERTDEGGVGTTAPVTAPTDTFLAEDIPLPVGPGCRELYDRVIGAFAGISSGAADETFSGFAEALDELRAAVPPELSDDLEVMAATYARIDEVLRSYDYDFARVWSEPEARAAVAAAFADEEGAFAEASAQLEAWFDEQCSAG